MESVTDGILLIDKPEKISSFKVCKIIKKKLGVKKVGHGGTLDPFATGLMVIGINRCTKLLPYFINTKKEYQGKMVLGEKRDSFDITGEITDEKDYSHINNEMIYENINNFLGVIKQKPPIFSALKHKGKPLYKYARTGVDVSKDARTVFIEEFRILNIDIPEIEFYIKCSKGTYIRSIANDFGIKLGTYAYLSELKRLAIGDFHLKNAVSLNKVDKKNIIKFEDIFNVKKFNVKDKYMNLFENGNQLLPEYLEGFSNTKGFFYVNSKNSIALSEFDEEQGVIKIKVLYKKTLH
jgi:tRNA pseudouridine55 synthase